MQIVIEISDQKYKWIVENPQTYTDEVHDAIRNGTPLPKGHGDLIDVDALYNSAPLCHTEEDGTACVEWREINDAPTIIEADKEEVDGK